MCVISSSTEVYENNFCGGSRRELGPISFISMQFLGNKIQKTSLSWRQRLGNSGSATEFAQH